MTVDTDSSGLILLAIVLAFFLFSGSPDVTDAVICKLMDTCPAFHLEAPK